MPSGPNWRSAADYNYLNGLSPSELAWEFLRRNPRYRRDYRATIGGLDQAGEFPERLRLRWGLRFPIDPDLQADDAVVVWLLDRGAPCLRRHPRLSPMHKPDHAVLSTQRA